MCQVVAYKRLKTMKNYNAVTSKSARGLSEVVVYERFQLQFFDWDKFSFLVRWSLTRGGRTWRFVYLVLSIEFRG